MKKHNTLLSVLFGFTLLTLSACRDTRVGSLLHPLDDASAVDFSPRSYLQENGRPYLMTSATIYTLNGRLEYDEKAGTITFPLRLTKKIGADYRAQITIDKEAKAYEALYTPKVTSKVNILPTDKYQIDVNSVVVPAGQVQSKDLFQVKLLEISSLEEGYYSIPLLLTSEDKGAKVSKNTNKFSVVLEITHDNVHGLWVVERTDDGLTQIPTNQLSFNNEHTNVASGDYASVTDGDRTTGVKVELEASIRIDGIGGSLKAIGLQALQEQFWGSMSLANFPSEVEIKYVDTKGGEHSLGQATIDPPTEYRNPDQFRLLKLHTPIEDAESIIIKMLKVQGWGWSVGISEVKLYH